MVAKKSSKISMMPPGLVNTMNANELKDLVAYFVSAGNSKHPVYKRPKSNKKLNIELSFKYVSDTDLCLAWGRKILLLAGTG